MSDPLDEFGAVTLDAAGTGAVTLAPDSFRSWNVTIINVLTSQGPTVTPVPQCTVFLGSEGDGNVISQTWNGSRATATGDVQVQPSQPLIVRWANGVPGSRATVSIYGTQTMR